jgi:phosphoribosylanthranilate isomerase
VIVQIYEIQTPEEAETCLDLGVDHVGSVLPPGESWRDPALREVIRVTQASGAKSSLIPLFEDAQRIWEALDFYKPDFIHFCASLTDRDGLPLDPGPVIQMQSTTRERFPEIGILRTIPIPPKGRISRFPTLQIARALEPFSTMFLTDTWLEEAPVTGYVGITGRPCDWDLAAELVLRSDIPVILAGGLSPDNVWEALLKTIPSGADSCTRTNALNAEGNPVRFRKDFEKVKAFVAEVRRAEGELRTLKAAVGEAMERLNGERRERERALPAHSIRPHQIMA